MTIPIPDPQTDPDDIKNSPIPEPAPAEPSVAEPDPVDAEPPHEPKDA